MHILDANKDNGKVLDAIRDAFWGRIRQWSWLSNAQVDRIWLTTVRRPNNCGFKHWPADMNMRPAPHIYLHSSKPPPSFCLAEIAPRD